MPWNSASISCTLMPGMTRSRLWRFRSTIHRTLPRRVPRMVSSPIASQMLPSSSSASPTSATNRRRWPSGRAEVCSRVAVGKRREERRGGAEARPNPSRSRRDRDPWSDSGTPASRRTRAASSGSGGRDCRAGTGWHETPGRVWLDADAVAGAQPPPKYSAVKIDTTEALLAWCPPTLVSSWLGRRWLASWIMRVASHSTRCWMRASTSRSGSAGVLCPRLSRRRRTSHVGSVQCARWPFQ